MRGSAQRKSMTILLMALAMHAAASASPFDDGTSMTSTNTGSCCPVIELRQYTLKPGQRDVLIELFEREFIETQETVGMRLIGQFRDRDRPDRFVWMRGFADMPSRAIALAAFYGGPTWMANRETANATMTDSDNVLLLRPVTPSSAFAVPTRERAPVGSTHLSESRILATIYYCDSPVDDEFRRFFDSEVAAILSETGATPIAQFETESAANTFPRLPVREGEHVFIWFAAFADEAALREHERQLAASPRWTSEVVPALTKYLKSPPERLILEPTPRSRLR